MLGRWRDSKARRGEQTLQIIPSSKLVIVSRICVDIAAIERTFADHPTAGSLFVSQIGKIPSKLRFPKVLAFVAYYARVSRVAGVQSKAEASRLRISPLKRVQGNVAAIMSHCWRQRCG